LVSGSAIGGSQSFRNIRKYNYAHIRADVKLCWRFLASIYWIIFPINGAQMHGTARRLRHDSLYIYGVIVFTLRLS